MKTGSIMTRAAILLSLLVSVPPVAAGTPRNLAVERTSLPAGRLPCSPFGIATGTQEIFDAVSAGDPALAVSRTLGRAHSDALFDQYQFGAYGGGIRASAPINQVVFLHSQLLRIFTLRAKQHDTASLLGLHIEAIGSYSRDSVGFTAGLTRRANDLRHRTLLYGIAKGVWLCGPQMLQRFFGAVLLDRQWQMREEATHVCPAHARRVRGIRVCW